MFLPTLLLAASLVSCGGGGGDPSPGGGGNPGAGDLNDVQAQATLGATTQSVDATNIFFGEKAQFRLVGFTDAGVETTVSPSGWTTTLPANVGTITSAGLFTAGNTAGSGTVSVTTGGKTFSSPIAVKGGAIAVLTGRVRLVSGATVGRIGIRALNAAGVEVARGFSAKDGTIRVGVPTNATRLNLNFDTVDARAVRYVRQYALNSIDYSTVIAGCTAPLPALTAGRSAPLPTDVVVYALGSGAPVPPPDGCTSTQQ